MIAADLPDPGAKAKIDSFAQRLRGEPGVDFVPDPVLNPAGNAAIVNVIPEGSPQDKETEDLVNHLRDNVVPEANSGCSCSVRVISRFGIRITVVGTTAVAVPIRCGCPARHPSPKKSPPASIATTASRPDEDRTDSFTPPSWI